MYFPIHPVSSNPNVNLSILCWFRTFVSLRMYKPLLFYQVKLRYQMNALAIFFIIFNSILQSETANQFFKSRRHFRRFNCKTMMEFVWYVVMFKFKWVKWTNKRKTALEMVMNEWNGMTSSQFRCVLISENSMKLLLLLAYPCCAQYPRLFFWLELRTFRPDIIEMNKWSDKEGKKCTSQKSHLSEEAKISLCAINRV